MNHELRELYRDVMIAHSKRPRNFRVLERGRRAEGYNPLCGDRLLVYVDVAGDRLHDITFQGSACAVCVASASLMTETLKGKSRAQAAETYQAFRAFLTDAAQPPASAVLGELTVFAGVRAFPSRIKCTLLAWRTLREALDGGATASTE